MDISNTNYTRGDTNHPFRILLCGVWDLFHYGHAQAMEKAKKLLPNAVLVVGIHSDDVVLEMKGKVVIEYEERRELLKHIKWIDEIVDNAPWVINAEFLNLHTIDFVAGSDDVYTKDGVDTYKEVKLLNKFIPISRTEGISSTSILTRLIGDYDKFVVRTMEKAPAKDIGGTELTAHRLSNLLKRKWNMGTGYKYPDLRVGGFVKVFGDTLLHSWNIISTVKESFIRKVSKRQKTTDTQEDEHAFEDEQIGTLIHQTCKDLVDGWKDIKFGELEINQVTGGLTNKLYKCAIPKDKASDLSKEKHMDVPYTVLFRLYGAGTESFFDREHEHKIFKRFSELGIGPKLYGLFDGGRIEQFMELRTLDQQDLPKLASLIAKKLAVTHTCSLPLPKSPSLFDSLHHWTKLCQKLSFEDDPHKQKLYNELSVKEKFMHELKFLKGLLQSFDSPVVFCHNDLLAGNIMYDDKTQHICFIDYEYGAYNFRGYDIGNHFCERSIQYNVEEYPHFKIDPSNYPKDDEKKIFLTSYLMEFKKQLGQPAVVLEEEWRILAREADSFALASHFLWSCWAIIQASTSDIEFGYLEFATERMIDYDRRKKSLLRIIPKD